MKRKQKTLLLLTVLAAFSLVFTGCPEDDDGGGESLVAVTNIDFAPGTAVVGEPFTLTGTVVPENATNKTIVWSVKNAGTTDASVSGNTLTTTAAGTVTVTATIANGTAIGTAYTQDFTILVETAVPFFTNVAALAAYLETLPSNTANNPAPVKVSINLDALWEGSVHLDTLWEELLETLNTAGKYVALDLTACSGMTRFFSGGVNQRQNPYIISLVLPATTTSILSSATTDRPFVRLTGLREITGENVTFIPFWAFRNHTSLTSVSFPAATGIGMDAFSGCTRLTSVSFSAAASIAQEAFRGCINLTNITVTGTGSLSVIQNGTVLVFCKIQTSK